MSKRKEKFLFVSMSFTKTSFPIIKFVECMENLYVDFSTCRQIAKISKISVKTPYDENLEYLLSNTF